ncbi:acetate/propionate family kinase [Desulfospira joergensenii]|uniref:acetate/propionate family kinase n=1 Tax=Desulfospira joergensenii TaxID=53329 RepID=UPI0003B3C75D|nr:acetate kinase [Desulfospira joergensenii]
MKILVINSGSSSIKYKLIDMDTEASLGEGVLERIGEAKGKILYHSHPGTSRALTKKIEAPISDHSHGMEWILSLLTDAESGVIENRTSISAIGHRVVQGGEKFKAPALIDDAVTESIRANIPLAPLHNPGALSGIITALDMFPEAGQVAVFDTAFHQTIPAKAYRYALPDRLYTEAGVRRFGFHGTSHRYITREAADYLEIPPDKINLISLHLGNGSSITAVSGGKSVDTSMGMTPLEGVIMGTRSGSIDPAIISYLADNTGMSLEEIMTLLTQESGLKGLCGYNDLRDIHRAAAAGNEQAELALDMLIYSYRKYIGAYFAVLGRVDCLVFTAGIGENDSVIRERVCRNLETFGIEVDPERNRDLSDTCSIISTSSSRVKVMVISTNEELEIARQTQMLI